MKIAARALRLRAGQFGQMEVRLWTHPLKQVAFRSRINELAVAFTEVAP